MMWNYICLTGNITNMVIAKVEELVCFWHQQPIFNCPIVKNTDHDHIGTQYCMKP